MADLGSSQSANTIYLSVTEAREDILRFVWGYKKNVCIRVETL